MTAPIPVAAPGLLAPDEAAEVRAAVDRVLSRGQFAGGEEVTAFETEFGDSVGPGLSCVGVGNGLDALVLALIALDLPAGGEVLVPANDGGYAALAAQSAGLRPVQVDVDDEGLIALPAIRGSSGAGTVAVITTHLHGLAADLSSVADWCRGRGIALIEDCSQAHGARGIGLLGDASAFSFYPTKNLGAMGDAGAVVTARPDLDERIRSLREYGWGPRFVITRPQGRNSRLDTVQAAVLRARLPHLGRATARRRAIVASYRRAAPGTRFLARADDTFVAHHAVLVDPARDRLAQHLDRAGVATAVHYPVLAADMPGLAALARAATPTASRLRDQQLTLPCYPGMTEEQVAIVCAALAEWEGTRD